MKLTVINPNSTVSMTDKIAIAARAAIGPEVEITGVTCHGSPPAIETPDDDAAAVPHVIAAVKAAEAAGADACIIACFDDPGLAEARAAVSIPVIGIGEAAFHLASLVGERFSVVTTLSRSIPVIEANLARYGLAGRCARVRASDVPVLALEEEGSDACDRISDEIGRAIAEDRAEAIVLGCAGMTDLARRLEAVHGVPVVDGVAAAVVLAEGLVRLGLATSKIGGWAPPLPKPYGGLFAARSPR